MNDRSQLRAVICALYKDEKSNRKERTIRWFISISIMVITLC